MRPLVRPLSIVFPLALLALPVSAHALDCFTVVSNASSLASDPAAAHSTALPVTLATGFRLNPRCTYGLSPDAARMAHLPVGETDFASLASSLAGLTHADASARPRTLYGRDAIGPMAAVESVFRESCTEALVSESGLFDAHVDTATGDLIVARRTPASGADCGAEQTALRFVRVTQGASATGLSAVAGAFTLDPGAQTVSLGHGDEFAVYAARTPQGAGLLVGHVGHSDPLTALRQALAGASRDTAPWLRARWSPAGDLQFGQAGELRDQQDVWPEMVTAAAANELWLADAPTASRGAHAPRVYGPMRVDRGNDAVVLPEGIVDDAMTRRYGPAGHGIVPTLDEWDALRRSLQVCLVDRYAVPQRGAAPESVPDGARCARLASIVAPVALDLVGGTPHTPRRLCVHRTVWEVSTQGANSGAPLPDVCMDLPYTARAEDAAPESTPVVAAMVGDRLAPEGPTDDLYVCIDNQCRPMREAVTVWQAGLVSVRHADTVEGAVRAEGLTLVRFVAIDPAAGWLPVGLYTGQIEDPGNPWASLNHDEPGVFSFTRRRQSLSFHLATSPTASAIWNARSLAAGGSPVLTETLPVVGGLSGAVVAPPASGLVVLVTRDDRCPSGPAATVRAEVPVDPDGLLVDQRFHVFLARTIGDTEPFECIAHAAFRVRESRAIAPLPWLHLGLLGDTQLAVFLTDPAALGVLLPLAYAHARLPWGFNLEAAVDLSAAVTFSTGDTSRAGGGLGVSLGWGPVPVLPRLISVGLLVDLATGSAQTNPALSPYVSLDFSTLIDLVGGR